MFLAQKHRRQLGTWIFLGLVVPLAMVLTTWILDAPLWARSVTLFLLFAGPLVAAFRSFSLMAGELTRLKSELKTQLEKQRKLRREMDALKNQALIAQRTQMLAHDVRKPLSLMKMAVSQIAGETSAGRIRDVVDRFVPAVEKALVDADRMINDVMEFGHESELIPEAVAPDALVESTVMSIFRVKKDVNVSFTYGFDHTHKVRVDSVRMLRVLSNIVENAVEAMDGEGTIRFSTCEVDLPTGPFVEMSVNNTGSFIAPEDREKIFDAFFTKGKKGGTGLGMAIARKIVRAHGGRIDCVSDQSKGTTFRLTLPRMEERLEKVLEGLPGHSGEIRIALEAARKRSLGRAFEETGEDVGDMESRIVRRAQGHQIRVLLIDDHPLYMTTLNAQLMEVEGLEHDGLECFMVSSAPEALETVSRERPHLIICDVDMGPNSPGGYELVKRIRRRSAHGDYRPVICMHSNHKSPRDFDSAKQAGADGFLPKPMSKESLLKLLLAALPDQGEDEREENLVRAGASKRKLAGSAAEVALVDDCPFTLETRESQLRDIRTHMFAGPGAMRTQAEEDPLFLPSLSCVVTDFHFEGEEETGLEFAAWLKERRPDLPVLLSSDAPVDTSGGKPSAIDRTIPKEPLDWERLRNLVMGIP